MSYKQDLEGVSAKDYGDSHTAHVFEIYKLYVEMADRISGRRQSANSFFLSFNTGVMAVVGYVDIGRETSVQPIFYFTVAMAGIVLCFFWQRLIRSYKGISSAKFKVIHDIESRLPLRPYDAEWTAVGRGKDADKYLPVSILETRVPWIFAGLYLLIIAWAIPWSDVI